MPSIPTAGDWYIVAPITTLDRDPAAGDLHGAAQVFVVQAEQSEVAAQIVMDAYPDYPAVAVAIGEWFVRPT